MRDFLDKLAETSKTSIREGYYESEIFASAVPVSLKKEIAKTRVAALITEIKGASPSRGIIRENFAPDKIAKAMARGGAVGISVLTEPKFFHGSLGYLANVREAVPLPILMKDIIVSPLQLDAAVQAGASAILLIQTLFDRGYCECSASEMIEEAQKRKLEVLLETHDKTEFVQAMDSAAEMVGINNRDLRTLDVNLNVTRDILHACSANGKIVVSESGINSPADVVFLQMCGAKAFLVGSAIMQATDIEAKVKELAQANKKGTE